MRFSNTIRGKMRKASKHYGAFIFTLGVSFTMMACGGGPKTEESSKDGGNEGGGGEVDTGPDTLKPGTWAERGNIISPGGYSFPFAMSSDSNKIAGAITNGHIFTSVDNGQNWTDRSLVVHDASGRRSWMAIVSSANGQKLVAAEDNGFIYTSVDSGATWAKRSPIVSDESIRLNWSGLASSSDGVKLAAVVNGGHIYTSDDSGEHWTDRSPAAGDASNNLEWYSIASSSDGKMLTAVTSGEKSPGNLYTSDDSGEHWKLRSLTTSTSGKFRFSSISSSADGKFIVAAATWNTTSEMSAKVFTSKDSGATWAERTPEELQDADVIEKLGAGLNIYFKSAISSDGSRIALLAIGQGESSHHLFTSPDFGETWFEQKIPPASSDFEKAIMYGIASSSDGRRINLVRAEFLPNVGSVPSGFKILSLEFP